MQAFCSLFANCHKGYRNMFTKIDKSVYFADRKTQKVLTNADTPDPIHGMYRDIVFNV